jgi:hypothetical protein
MFPNENACFTGVETSSHTRQSLTSLVSMILGDVHFLRVARASRQPHTTDDNYRGHDL